MLRLRERVRTEDSFQRQLEEFLGRIAVEFDDRGAGKDMAQVEIKHQDGLGHVVHDEPVLFSESVFTLQSAHPPAEQPNRRQPKHREHPGDRPPGRRLEDLHIARRAQQERERSGQPPVIGLHRAYADHREPAAGHETLEFAERVGAGEASLDEIPAGVEHQVRMVAARATIDQFSGQRDQPCIPVGVQPADRVDARRRRRLAAGHCPHDRCFQSGSRAADLGESRHFDAITGEQIAGLTSMHPQAARRVLQIEGFRRLDGCDHPGHLDPMAKPVRVGEEQGRTDRLGGKGEGFRPRRLHDADLTDVRHPQLISGELSPLIESAGPDAAETDVGIDELARRRLVASNRHVGVERLGGAQLEMEVPGFDSDRAHNSRHLDPLAVLAAPN